MDTEADDHGVKQRIIERSRARKDDHQSSAAAAAAAIADDKKEDISKVKEAIKARSRAIRETTTATASATTQLVDDSVMPEDILKVKEAIKARSPTSGKTTTETPSATIQQVHDCVMQRSKDLRSGHPDKDNSAAVPTVIRNSNEGSLPVEAAGDFESVTMGSKSNNHNDSGAHHDHHQQQQKSSSSGTATTTTMTMPRATKVIPFEAEAALMTMPEVRGSGEMNILPDGIVDVVHHQDSNDDKSHSSQSSSTAHSQKDTITSMSGQTMTGNTSDINIKAELAPDFEGLAAEHNALLERVVQMEAQGKKIVEAEVVEVDNGEGRCNNKRNMLLGILVLFVIMAIVIPISVIYADDDSTGEQPEITVQSSSNPSPTLPPTPNVIFETDTERYLAFRAIFDELYGPDTYLNETRMNKRFRALHWLANEDDAKLDPITYAQEELQNRYIMALLFFNNGGYYYWSTKTNWMTAAPICLWKNLGCVASTNLAESLDLGGLGLTGTIPAEVGDLTHLTIFRISQNSLEGTIPTELGKLVKMDDFSIGHNSDLVGPVPAEIGNMTAVTFISMTGNNHNGTLPSELGKLSSLKYLFIGKNEFEGTIPTEIWDLPLLERFHAHDNKFIGSLDHEICNSTHLYLYRDNIALDDVGADCISEIICSCCNWCCNTTICCDNLRNGDWSCRLRG